MKAIGLFCLFLQVATTTLAADDAQSIENLLHRFLAGVSAGDRSVHEWFWADDLVYTSSSGARFGKAEIVVPPTSNDESEVTVSPVYRAEDVDTRVYGDAAVLAFMLVSESPGDDDTEAEVTRFYNTGMLLKREGAWSVVAWQATRIPEPAAP